MASRQTWRAGLGLALFALLAGASLSPSARRAQLGLAPRGPLDASAHEEPTPELADGPETRSLSVGSRKPPVPRKRQPAATEPLSRRSETQPPDEAPELSSPTAEDPFSPDADDEPRLARPELDGPLWMIPGAMPEAGPRPAAPTMPPRRATDPDVAGKLLARSLQRRNKLNGIDLSAGATVANAVSDGARLHLPGVSQGLFRASIGADGTLTDIRVLSFSDGSAEPWRKAARHAESRLAGRTFVLPGRFARGAVVTVRVTSNLQLPSGRGRTLRHRPLAERPIPLELESQKPRWPFAPRYGARTPLRLRGRDYPLETDLQLPRIHMGDEIEDGEIAAEGLTFGGSNGALVSGGFDVSDIGAHPQRVIDTSFVCEPLSSGDRSGS